MGRLDSRQSAWMLSHVGRVAKGSGCVDEIVSREMTARTAESSVGMMNFNIFGRDICSFSKVL